MLQSALWDFSTHSHENIPSPGCCLSLSLEDVGKEPWIWDLPGIRFPSPSAPGVTPGEVKHPRSCQKRQKSRWRENQPWEQ
ncbi:hypothetical protein Nmel_003526 [Mimus melanotis]